MVCENGDKCLKCGQMFKFNESKPETCVANHKTLSIILILIVIFLMVTISLGFYCTNLTPDEERELIEKMERKNREQEMERNGTADGASDDDSVNVDPRNRRQNRVERELGRSPGAVRDTEMSQLNDEH